MRKNLLNKLLIGILLTASSCAAKKAVKPVVAPAAVTENASGNAAVLKTVASAQPSFNTLSIRAKAGLKINNNSNDVSMNIRMQKSRIIWVSVTAIAGIEVARALITPDSIKVLNRLQGEYLAKPFSYIHRYAGRKVDFATVEALLTGSVVPGTLNAQAVIEDAAGQLRLSGDLSGLAYRMLFNAASNLIENELSDKPAGQQLKASYADFQKTGGQALPQGVMIKSGSGNQNLTLELKYNSIAVNESLDFPFTVPKRFSVIN